MKWLSDPHTLRALDRNLTKILIVSTILFGASLFVISGSAQTPPPTTPPPDPGNYQLSVEPSELDRSGTVTVTWKISRDDMGERRFSISWAESGGPPATNDGERGFGSTVLLKVAPTAVGGEATLTFAPEGLRWTLEGPAKLIESAAEKLSLRRRTGISPGVT
jgi:hypothetical protein